MYQYRMHCVSPQTLFLPRLMVALAVQGLNTINRAWGGQMTADPTIV